MVDYADLKVVIGLLENAQEAEYDSREAAREADNFLNKRDGQWEPQVIQNMNKRPRYTFDKVNPIVDQIMGEIDQSLFSISIDPAGQGADKQTAKLYNGMVRQTQHISSSDLIFSESGRKMVGTGLAGWRIITDWPDADSFDQELLIKRISNFVDRVWFDENSEEPDRSDARYCFVLSSVLTALFKEKWPGQPTTSVGDDRSTNSYFYKPDTVVIGEFLYKKETMRELVLMSNGRVYVADNKFEQVKDDLEQMDIREVRRRERKIFNVYSRKFSNDAWLEKEKETVFTEWLPVIPVYGNHTISEDKFIFYGAVEKLMDPQRVHNYAKSRDVEEGALAPRSKIFMTREQAAGNTLALSTLNTNSDPVQFYAHVEGHAPPFQMGGAQTNQGLQLTAQDASRDINVAAGLFAANMGDNPGLQSGIAIQKQQNKGDNGTWKYFASMKRSIEHTSKILVKAYPKVISERRDQIIRQKNGETETVTLLDPIFDADSKSIVKLNDISKGSYDVTCIVSDSYQSQQQETVDAITKYSVADPSIVALSGDVLLNNINAPGMDIIAERKRALMVQQGAIPPSQLTEAEKKLLAEQAAQPKEPSPVEKALMEEAAANMKKAQAQTADVMSKIQEREEKMDLAQKKALAEIRIANQKLDLEVQSLAIDMDNAENVKQGEIFRQQMEIQEKIKIQAETLKILAEAMQIDTSGTDKDSEAYKRQAGNIDN